MTGLVSRDDGDRQQFQIALLPITTERGLECGADLLHADIAEDRDSLSQPVLCECDDIVQVDGAGSFHAVVHIYRRF